MCVPSYLFIKARILKTKIIFKTLTKINSKYTQKYNNLNIRCKKLPCKNTLKKLVTGY